MDGKLWVVCVLVALAGCGRQTTTGAEPAADAATVDDRRRSRRSEAG